MEVAAHRSGVRGTPPPTAPGCWGLIGDGDKGRILGRERTISREGGKKDWGERSDCGCRSSQGQDFVLRKMST